MAKQESIEARLDKLLNRVDNLEGTVSILKKENIALKNENRQLKREGVKSKFIELLQYNLLTTIAQKGLFKISK